MSGVVSAAITLAGPEKVWVQGTTVAADADEDDTGATTDTKPATSPSRARRVRVAVTAPP